MPDITHPDTARVLRDVATERARQVDKNWTRDHDDRHDTDTLVRLSASYARRQGKGKAPGYFDRERLVQAAALLVAAVEAMDRREARDAE